MVAWLEGKWHARWRNRWGVTPHSSSSSSSARGRRARRSALEGSSRCCDHRLTWAQAGELFPEVLSARVLPLAGAQAARVAAARERAVRKGPPAWDQKREWMMIRRRMINFSGPVGKCHHAHHATAAHARTRP